MFKFRLLGAMLALLTLSSACGSARLLPPELQPLPTAPASWTVRLTQSGGFIGVLLTVEVTSDGRLTAEDQRAGRHVSVDLPPQTVTELASLYSEALGAPQLSRQTGCMDCFIYDLEMNSSGSVVRVHADDTNLNDSGAAKLIELLQQLRDDALKAQP